jgi:small redox-active disulfide protein 2
MVGYLGKGRGLKGANSMATETSVYKGTDVTRINVANQPTGIIGLEQVLKEVASEFSGRPDDEIQAELLKRLSKNNYIYKKIRDQYGKAFLKEFKKYIGETFEEDKSDTMEIKVFGPGCARCSQLEQDIMRAMTETGIVADIEHIRDSKEIRRHGINTTPALVINGKTLAIGSVPQQSQIEVWLQQATEKMKL